MVINYKINFSSILHYGMTEVAEGPKIWRNFSRYFALLEKSSTHFWSQMVANRKRFLTRRLKWYFLQWLPTGNTHQLLQEIIDRFGFAFFSGVSNSTSLNYISIKPINSTGLFELVLSLQLSFEPLISFKSCTVFSEKYL